YFFFATLVAFAKLIAGAGWPVVLVAANLIFDGMTAAILTRLVILAARSTAAVLAAIGAWLVCFDLVNWVRMPLTDVPFLLTSFAAFATLAAPCLAGKALTKKSLLFAALLVVISLLLRPVGFLWLILMAVVFAVASRGVRRRHVIASGL